MYKVIGHEDVRHVLASWNDSFVIVGPHGVGRSGILSEKMSTGIWNLPGYPTASISSGACQGVRNFFVGFLSDEETTEILKRAFPHILNRNLAVSIMAGTFERIGELEDRISAHEEVEVLLDTHAIPQYVSRYLLEATTQACLKRLSGSRRAFNETLIRNSIPEFLALWYLNRPPTEASTIQFYYGVKDGYLD